MASHPPVGIDLGTTYSAIAYLDETGRPTSIANDAGDVLTPSAVSFDGPAVLVGKEAIKQGVFEPEVFADCFKRDIGRREFHRPIAGQHVPPEVLSAFVLKKLKQDAERRLGPIEEAVITVPAFFDETRRRATQEAGRLAGLKVLDIINEPTAAAVAFGYQSGDQERTRAGLRPGRRHVRRHRARNRWPHVSHLGHRRRRAVGRQGFRPAARGSRCREIPRGTRFRSAQRPAGRRATLAGRARSQAHAFATVEGGHPLLSRRSADADRSLAV